jgi:hypothetical protein
MPGNKAIMLEQILNNSSDFFDVKYSSKRAKITNGSTSIWLNKFKVNLTTLLINILIICFYEVFLFRLKK